MSRNARRADELRPVLWFGMLPRGVSRDGPVDAVTKPINCSPSTAESTTRRAAFTDCNSLPMSCAFSQSEQLLEAYPTVNGCPLVISVYLQFDPPEEAVIFLTSVRNVLADRSINFCWKARNGQ